MGQALALQPDVYIGDERSKELVGRLIDVMRKLQSTKYHLNQCNQLTEKLIAEAEAKEGMAPHADPTGIESEVEAFLMQAKSTLDLLVKILDPLIGLKSHSFGDRGS